MSHGTASHGTARHWAAGYIGRPWVAGRSDCWNFARTVWAEIFGLDVPAVQVDVTSALAARRALRDGGRTGWTRVGRAEEGDAVLMSTGARPCHVGVFAAPDGCDGIVHSVEGAGVIWTPLNRIGALGYQVAGFWRREPE